MAQPISMSTTPPLLALKAEHVAAHMRILVGVPWAGSVFEMNDLIAPVGTEIGKS